MEQVPERPWIGVRPSGELQYDVAAEHNRRVCNQGIERATLALLRQIQKRLGHFKEHFDIPAPGPAIGLSVNIASQLSQYPSIPVFGSPFVDNYARLHRSE